MSSIKWLLGGLLLLPGGGRAATLPGQASVQVTSQSSVVGQPVTVTFQVDRPAGKIVFWSLTDRAFSSVILLKSETCAVPKSASQHEVVFTATQGGLCELGPFAVVLEDWQGADTLYAPRLQVQFRAEALRSSLHPLRGIATGWQSWETAQSNAWSMVGLLCIGVGLGWVLWEKLKNSSSALESAPSPMQVQKLALHRLATLEQAAQASVWPLGKIPDQIFSIVNECLIQIPAQAVTDKAALAALSQARFDPTQEGKRGSAKLINQAKHLIISWEMPAQTASQRV